MIRCAWLAPAADWDDWAWKRGQCYGTVICDLERRRIVDLLPNREPATVEAWLAEHQGIEIIARDRSGGYSKAAVAGASKATQVADRWHLMANASAAFLEAVRRSMRKIRDAIGAAEIDPELLTCAERRQFEEAKRREATNAAILALAKAGMPIKEKATAAARSAALCGVVGLICFARARARSIPTGTSSRWNGKAVVMSAPSFGVACGRPGSTAACGW